jgi:excisionase family DNA binding protein
MSDLSGSQSRLAPSTAGDAARAAAPGAWLTIGAASRMLGVSTATLRRWADNGVIAWYPTLGGHRRFARSAVEAVLPRQATRHAVPSGVASVDLVHRAYRRSLQEIEAAPGFLDGVPSGAREPLREYGRVVTSSILGYLESTTGTARDAALAEGLIAAAAYGRISGTLGATMRETVNMFLRFRMPFVHEMGEAVRRRDLDASGATEFLESMSCAIDRLLDATLEGYEHGAVRAEARPAHRAAYEEGPRP